MDALEYLQKNVKESNLPENFYEAEIAGMMEGYANHNSNLVENRVSFAEPNQLKAGWIDVNDKLPLVGSPVLIYDGDNIAVARLSERGSWWIHESYGFNEDGQIPEVYYWRQLPDPPKP